MQLGLQLNQHLKKEECVVFFIVTIKSTDFPVDVLLGKCKLLLSYKINKSWGCNAQHWEYSQ